MNRMHFEPIRIYFSHLRSSTGGVDKLLCEISQTEQPDVFRLYTG